MLRKSTRKFKKPETLSDDQKRLPMTNMVAGANGGFGGAGGLADLTGRWLGGFEIFFLGGGGACAIQSSSSGDDLQYRVNLTFEEAILEQKRS